MLRDSVAWLLVNSMRSEKTQVWFPACTHPCALQHDLLLFPSTVVSSSPTVDGDCCRIAALLATLSVLFLREAPTSPVLQSSCLSLILLSRVVPVSTAQFNMLCEQSLHNVWRKRAFAALLLRHTQVRACLLACCSVRCVRACCSVL